MVPNAAASASNQLPLPGSAPGDRVGTDGRYELVERIGSGGMGAVFRAIDHKLGCERAVKVLDARYSLIPAFVERFRREAMAASRVSHPNIVAVLDVAAAGERPVFLVMELLEGQTLSQLVKGSGRMPWAQVQRYIDQIAAGLGAAHAQGVVHRDVKPGNCLVLPDDQIKILDFGIAKVTDMPAQVVALTAAGEIIGTCSYMAPEQIRGQVDKRSDIYALGVLTFRLLTGRVPFSHSDQDKVLLAHLTEPPPVPSSIVTGLPPGVDDFVLRMLAKQPHKRFDGMEELRRVLAGLERGQLVALDAPTAVPPSKSSTAMFEDMPTRAVPREARHGEGSPHDGLADGSTPSPAADHVRARINTAPAGSGTLAQLDAQGLRMPGTIVLEDPAAAPVSSGGTVVVQGPPVPVVPPGLDVEPAVSVPVVGSPPAVVPPRAATERAPVPRPLGGLAASSAAPPRATRIAVPREVDAGSSSMVRGVVAALGGIALAVAVVVGWVLYTRSVETRSAAAAPADAAAMAVEEPAAAPVVAAEGEPEPAIEPEAAPLPGDAAIVAEPAAREAAKLEAKTPDATSEAVVGSLAEPDALVPPPSEPPVTDGKAKKRRKPKAGETKPPEVTEPEPEPEVTEPEPETPKKKKKKSGDLRDPF